MSYILEKHKILNTLELITATVNNRLISSFDNLETEAEGKAQKQVEELKMTDNQEACMEEAYYVRERHLKINYAMKQEVLNNASVWLFHIFEKDCVIIFKTMNETEKREYLQSIKINTERDSAWWKINHELKLVANAIKHGKGTSYSMLEALRPDLFNGKTSFFSKVNIDISSKEFNNYSKVMQAFWVEYFDKSK